MKNIPNTNDLLLIRQMSTSSIGVVVTLDQSTVNTKYILGTTRGCQIIIITTVL